MGRWLSGFAEGSHNFSWRTEGSNPGFFQSNFQPRASDYQWLKFWHLGDPKAIQGHPAGPRFGGIHLPSWWAPDPPWCDLPARSQGISSCVMCGFQVLPQEPSDAKVTVPWSKSTKTPGHGPLHTLVAVEWCRCNWLYRTKMGIFSCNTC